MTPRSSTARTLSSTLGLACLLVVLPLLAAAPQPAVAQGVTTSAISGTVTGPDGVPVAQARVEVVHAAAGTRSGALTDGEGRYLVPHLRAGGPYEVRVERIGFQDERRDGIVLALGQTYRLDVELRDEAIQLEELIVHSDAIFHPGRTGQETVVRAEDIRNLPTLSRNFTDLAALNPLVYLTEDAPSVAGQNNRYNNIQIDGAQNNDLFGLAASGLPGGQADAKPISQEAIQEFQVLVAPFDVRQAGFTGGLVNAVTRSGTNRLEGSVFGYYRNQSLLRETLRVGEREFPVADFTNSTLGFTLGGPIVADRAHFFVAAETEERDRPLTAGVGSSPSDINIDPATVEAVGAIARDEYGLDFGRTDAYTLRNPARNLFARLDWQLSDDHRLTLRHNYSYADTDTSPSRFGTFSPSSNTYRLEGSTHGTVLQLFSRLGERWSNELLANVQFIRDERRPEVEYGQVQVNTSDAQNASGAVRFGADIFAHAGWEYQDVLQVSNSLTGHLGDHRVTVGVAQEYIGFDDLFVPRSRGSWSFASPADFEAGIPSRYEIEVPSPERGGTVEDAASRFGVMQLSAWVQDEWRASPRLTLTYGVRGDFPWITDDPYHNPAFADAFGFSNADLPSGGPLIQPRIGFNYRAEGDARTQWRGGVGIFAGRPPFVWLGNVFGHTGVSTLRLVCGAGNAPAFSGSAAHDPPTACADGSTAQEAGLAEIAVVDSDFRWPQEVKLNLAVDRDLPWGLRGTLEGIFTRGVTQVIVDEINLQGVREPGGSTRGLGPREFYGEAVAAPGSRRIWAPAVHSEEFLSVTRLANTSAPYGYALVAEVEGSLGDRYHARASYTHGRSFDELSMTSSIASSNFGFSPVGASITDRETTPTAFDRPHRVLVHVSGRFFEEVGGTTVSLLYRGQSGRNYSYVYSEDANGDGYGSAVFSSGSRNNDLVYVPAELDEILWASDEDRRLFAELTELEPCLGEARGAILARNACRAEWAGYLDMRLAQSLPRVPGRVELVLDVFNLPNLLNESWGVVEATPFNTVPLLSILGREGDVPEGDPVLGYTGASETIDGERRALRPMSVLDADSRWRMNLGVRISF